MESTLGDIVTSEIPSQLHQMSVIDFVDCNGTWNSGSFQHLLPTEGLLKVAAIPPLTDCLGEDKPFWGLTPSSSFTVSSIFEAVTEGVDVSRQRNQNLMWRRNGLGKVRMFLWLVLNNALLTNSEHARCHMVADSSREVCGAHQETIEHVLRDYDNAFFVWHELIGRAKVGEFLSSPFNDWFSKNLLEGNETYDIAWNTLFGTACWQLWSARNREVIVGEETCTKSLVLTIKAKAMEFQVSRTNFLNIQLQKRYKYTHGQWGRDTWRAIAGGLAPDVMEVLEMVTRGMARTQRTEEAKNNEEVKKKTVENGERVGRRAQTAFYRKSKELGRDKGDSVAVPAALG
ncbi:hypothetical protein Scep_003828 [Stephania cephalantha]|uniref:Reverse transcriptase zinc-binding domain-containing protein n=1 Tax=Stephania cephalantha TaxID=152367 RepID=A0AAP0PWP6_9MAGN